MVHDLKNLIKLVMSLICMSALKRASLQFNSKYRQFHAQRELS